MIGFPFNNELEVLAAVVNYYIAAAAVLFDDEITSKGMNRNDLYADFKIIWIFLKMTKDILLLAFMLVITECTFPLLGKLVHILYFIWPHLTPVYWCGQHYPSAITPLYPLCPSPQIESGLSGLWNS